MLHWKNGCPDDYFALGYGRGIAETFAQHGAKVMVLDIDEESAKQSEPPSPCATAEVHATHF